MVKLLLLVSILLTLAAESKSTNLMKFSANETECNSGNNQCGENGKCIAYSDGTFKQCKCKTYYYGVYCLHKNTSMIDSIRNHRSLIPDPILASMFVASVSTANSYATSQSCPFFNPQCEYASIMYYNHFCSFSLTHVKTYYTGSQEDNPTYKITPGQGSTGGQFFGSFSVSGVIRYKMEIDSYSYIIDIFWCVDCSVYGLDDYYDNGDTYYDYDGFGMAIGGSNRNSLSVEKSYLCFVESFEYYFDSDSNPKSLNYCSFSSDTGFVIVESGESSYSQTQLTLADGIGVKLKSMMDDSTAHVIDVNVFPVNGKETTQCNSN